MPITSLVSDPETLSLTLVGDYPVPVARLWEAYADPRQLEKFWGPVGYPATFTRHDFAVGGTSRYYMTAPDGTQFPGSWRWIAVEPHRMFEIVDGDAGTSAEDVPGIARMTFRFETTAGGSRVTWVTRFVDLAAMERVLAMGMLEGAQSAAGQLDDVLGDLTSFAANLAAEAQLLNATQVRVSRVIRGSVAEVWRAHHDPALLKRWLLGPPGWTMPVCEVAAAVGDGYRYEWAAADGSQRFGFEGELLESDAPYRAVTTERMMGTDGPGTTNVLTLAAVEGGTLLTLVITYPDQALRDMVLGTGMVGGMEQSYARLEGEVLA